MTRLLSIEDITELHRRVVAQSGGAAGLRDAGALASAVAQPLMSFGGVLLYPTLAEQAAAIGFSLVANHPFVDGNKRAGHAAMEVMLVMNGHELAADVDEQERVILRVAAGGMRRDEFAAWVAACARRFGERGASAP